MRFLHDRSQIVRKRGLCLGSNGSAHDLLGEGYYLIALATNPLFAEDHVIEHPRFSLPFVCAATACRRLQGACLVLVLGDARCLCRSVHHRLLTRDRRLLRDLHSREGRPAIFRNTIGDGADVVAVRRCEQRLLCVRRRTARRHVRGSRAIGEPRWDRAGDTRASPGDS